MRVILGLAWILACLPLGAESPAHQLDAVSQNLDAIVADLEANQARAEELQDRLAALEAVSSQHQEALRTQGKLLADYQADVAALEAHDRTSLALAETLRGQLELERRTTTWVWLGAGVALAVAVIEGIVLGARR